MPYQPQPIQVPGGGGDSNVSALVQALMGMAQTTSQPFNVDRPAPPPQQKPDIGGQMAGMVGSIGSRLRSEQQRSREMKEERAYRTSEREASQQFAQQMDEARYARESADKEANEQKARFYEQYQNNVTDILQLNQAGDVRIGEAMDSLNNRLTEVSAMPDGELRKMGHDPQMWKEDQIKAIHDSVKQLTSQRNNWFNRGREMRKAAYERYQLGAEAMTTPAADAAEALTRAGQPMEMEAEGMLPELPPDVARLLEVTGLTVLLGAQRNAASQAELEKIAKSWSYMSESAKNQLVELRRSVGALSGFDPEQIDDVAVPLAKTIYSRLREKVVTGSPEAEHKIIAKALLDRLPETTVKQELTAFFNGELSAREIAKDLDQGKAALYAVSLNLMQDALSKVEATSAVKDAGIIDDGGLTGEQAQNMRVGGTRGFAGVRDILATLQRQSSIANANDEVLGNASRRADQVLAAIVAERMPLDAGKQEIQQHIDRLYGVFEDAFEEVDLYRAVVSGQPVLTMEGRGALRDFRENNPYRPIEGITPGVMGPPTVLGSPPTAAPPATPAAATSPQPGGWTLNKPAKEYTVEGQGGERYKMGRPARSYYVPDDTTWRQQVDAALGFHQQQAPQGEIPWREQIQQGGFSSESGSPQEDLSRALQEFIDLMKRNQTEGAGG